MKSALHLGKLTTGALLCLLLLATRARGVENVAPPATSPAMTNPKPALVAALEEACDGLLMPSETDAPFQVVFFAREKLKTDGEKPSQPEIEAGKTKADKAGTDKTGTDKAKVGEAQNDGETVKLTASELAAIAGAPPEAKVETRDLAAFFKVATTVEDWMNEDERATARRFGALLEMLQTQVKNAQVLVWGDAEKHVAIIGEVDEGLAGVTTLVVET